MSGDGWPALLIALGDFLEGVSGADAVYAETARIVAYHLVNPRTPAYAVAGLAGQLTELVQVIAGDDLEEDDPAAVLLAAIQGAPEV